MGDKSFGCHIWTRMWSLMWCLNFPSCHQQCLLDGSSHNGVPWMLLVGANADAWTPMSTNSAFIRAPSFYMWLVLIYMADIRGQVGSSRIHSKMRVATYQEMLSTHNFFLHVSRWPLGKSWTILVVKVECHSQKWLVAAQHELLYLGVNSSNVVFLFLGDDWWHGKAIWTMRMCRGLQTVELDGWNILRRATFDAMAPDGNNVWQACSCEVARIGIGTLNGWLDVASGVDCCGVDKGFCA